MYSEVIVPFLEHIERCLKVIEPAPPALYKIRYLLFSMGTTVEEDVGPDDHIRDGSGVRLLLVEIIRRTAYDWVLYRDSSRIEQKQLASDSYNWLFEEDEQRATWATRKREGRTLTAFVTICQILDLDINKMRQTIRKLTPDKVVASGRFTTTNTPNNEDKMLQVHTKLAFEGDYDFEGFEV